MPGNVHRVVGFPVEIPNGFDPGILAATPRRVRRWVSSGRGEAIIFFRATNWALKDDLIFDICKRRQEFDGQLEDRSLYLWEVVKASSNPDSMLHRLVRAMTFSRDDSNRYSMMKILGHAHRSGHEWLEQPILHAIRARMNPREICYASDYVGIPGLKLALRHRHRLENWQLASSYSTVEDRIGKRKAESAIKKLCKSLKISLEEVQELMAPSEYVPEPVLDPLQAIIDGRFVPKELLKSFTDDEWNRLSEIVLHSDAPEQIHRARSAFRRMRKPFVGDLDTLVDRIRNPISERSQWAHGQLAAEVTDARVRELGLKLLRSASPGEFILGVDMLCSNSSEQDWPIIWESMQRRINDDDLHSLGIGVVSFKHPVPSRLLRFLLERLRCELCRGRIVKTLGERGELTSRELVALLFDSDYTTPERAYKALREISRGRNRSGRKE